MIIDDMGMKQLPPMLNVHGTGLADIPFGLIFSHDARHAQKVACVSATRRSPPAVDRKVQGTLA